MTAGDRTRRPRPREAPQSPAGSPFGGPPKDEQELAARARALEGWPLGEIADRLGFSLAGEALRTKGKMGELIERALGATGGSSRVVDFPELGVELKTVPVDARGVPRESTYVCTLPLDDVEAEEWESSWVRAKLARVLWVPIDADGPLASRRVGRATLWSPSAEQERVLRADFEDALGTIALGGIEGLSARRGTYLQVRPKAKDGAARSLAWGRDGERIPTVARGFYLRATFTASVLAAARAGA